jgi:hypothetical protein
MTMALPKQSAPMYNLKVPSTGASIKYRPFMVKEEKALLIAQQSEDPQVMVDTLKSVISSCVESKDVEVDSFATFDLEYLFTQIRAKSVGETVELLFQCDTDHGEMNEKARAKVTIDLTKIEVKKVAGHTNKISLFGDVGVVMKYPSIEVLSKLQGMDETNIESVFGIMIDSIDYIFDNEEIYHAKEQSSEELMEFLNNLSSDQFLKIQNFFTSMPKLSKEIEYDCPVCGRHHKKVLEGLQSFF